MRSLLPEPSEPSEPLGPLGPLGEPDLAACYAVPDGDGPHLRMNFVASPDGAATLDGLTEGLQTRGDNRVFALLRDLTDVVLVGAGTIRDEGYGALRPGQRRRQWRQRHGLAEVPALAVVSGRLDLNPGAELFTGAVVRPLVITHGASPAPARAALAEVAEVIVAGESAVDLPGALAALADRGLRRILCEGGPHLFGGLLAAGCVDELCLTLTPMLTGPGAGRIVAGPLVPAPVQMRLAHLLEEDGALFCRYAVVRRPAG
jgi:riboflavin biosynthesis pyrimidine reductase